MNSDMSPDSEQFIQHVVSVGAYPTRGEALDKAVELLKRREQLVTDVNAGIEQLERGEGEPLDIDAIKAKVAARLEQTKSKQR